MNSKTVSKNESQHSVKSNLRVNFKDYGSLLSSQTSFDTGHEELVNDAKMDYFGRKLATASVDKSVRMFAVDCMTGGYHRLAVLTGYDGPVLRLAWSHPKFGSMLATACYDGRIIIWKEVESDSPQSTASRWRAVFDQQLHKSSVNAVSWAAPDFGAMLAAASSDGSVSISLMNKHEGMSSEIIKKAHELGCQAVSWSCSAKRFATGGNDYNVKIWGFSDDGKWILESVLQAHTDWVSNVEWSPVAEIVISTGRDGRILLWTRKEEVESPAWNHSINQSIHHINISLNLSASEADAWSLQVLQTMERGSMPYISWDPMGTFLCISGDSTEISIWKQDKENWKLVTKPRIINCKLSESLGV